MQDVLVECISFILFQHLLLNWLFYCVTGHLEESQLKSCSSWQKDLACFCIYSTFLVIGSCPGEGDGKCINISCRNYDEFLNLLHNCPKKNISSVDNCPSIRSCPHCKEAIEHVDACNNMECFSCKKHFCFICLEPANDRGSLQCKQPHVVAPPQKLS
ncbi:uncharacterized protein LOC132747434 isoform X3 [Ruditapes philippinarum]|uniref:uncharacterized protein LOC132747434 isoform X3 n=1 Tax=Ruditapes philippinarum TaxID=129788 RepID=UPI00295BBC56|nr:uncharacterized protein LOC132747434 isoform X3 [Ruditapes philippinarum]